MYSLIVIGDNTLVSRGDTSWRTSCKNHRVKLGRAIAIGHSRAKSKAASQLRMSEFVVRSGTPVGKIAKSNAIC